MRVLIADDDALIREGLKILLELEEDIEVVGTAQDGRVAYEKCLSTKPDIALMDIRMPQTDGIQGARLIKESCPNVKIVMLTTFIEDEFILEAIKNGAEGYILKNQSSESIIESLRAVYSGNAVFDARIVGKISGMMREGKKPERADDGLTNKEIEILSNIATGLTNKEISEKLFLSEGTIRNYISVILDKLQLRDRTQLAIFYLKNFD